MPKPTHSPDDASPCPRWCVRTHADSDHVDDRYHRGSVSVIPGVADDGEPVEVIVYIAADEISAPAVVIEESERPRRIALTVPTALAVMAAAHAAIERLTDPPHGQSKGTNE